MGNRREVLALMGAAALAGGPALAADTPVIEWNMHMFSANVAKFPFHPNAVYKQAFKNYKTKFMQIGLAGVVEFVDSWGGFNRATKWAWRWLMGVRV